MKPPLVDRVSHLVGLCGNRRVLHLGCTNAPYTEQSIEAGSLLHDRLASVASELWGLDGDAAGLERLRARGTARLVAGDLEQLAALRHDALPESFDVIVAGEVIEHLSNPGLFLEGIKRFMSPETTLVVSTINTYSAMRFVIYWLRGRGGIREPVHPDHVAYYSYSTLHRLLDRFGLEVRRCLYYDLGPEHRPYNRFYWNWTNDLAVLAARQLADGLIVECRLAGAPRP